MSSRNLEKEAPERIKVGKGGKSGAPDKIASARRDVEEVVANPPRKAVVPPHGRSRARPEVEARTEAFSVEVDAPHHDENVELLLIDARSQFAVIDQAALGQDAKGEGVHDHGALAEQHRHGGIFGE